MIVENYLVAIQCATYNHEPYIRQCLEGFVMQKTDFKFVAIVHDDASTDGTAAIVREYAEKYPDIIKPIYETENQYSKHDGSISRIIRKAINDTGCKYIAICEGDDYWIDPLKLQRQVDYMENNHNCSLTYYKVKCFDQELNKVVAIYGKERKFLKDRLLKECFVSTCTSCFKRSDYNSYLDEIKPHTHNWLMGDIPLFLYLGTKGYGKMFDSCACVYRIVKQSASHSTNIELCIERNKNTISIYRFFADKYYPNSNRIKRKLEGEIGRAHV